MDGNLSSPLDTSIQRRLKIMIPEALKVRLVDDWDLITRQQKLALLPAKLTVAQIADNYLTHMQSTKTIESTLNNVINHIIYYFNKMLGPQLLYKFERPQYSKIIEDYPGTPMSEMYGSIHLLRLFTRMGPMVAYTDVDEESLKDVTKHIHLFLKYLMTNNALFSLLDYGDATPEYIKKYGNTKPAYCKDMYAFRRKAK